MAHRLLFSLKSDRKAFVIPLQCARFLAFNNKSSSSLRATFRPDAVVVELQTLPEQLPSVAPRCTPLHPVAAPFRIPLSAWQVAMAQRIY